MNLGLFFFGTLLFITSVWLMLLILVQRGKGGGLTGALGGPGGQSAFGAKAGDAFTKITTVSAIVWITLCMLTIVIFNPPPAKDTAAKKAPPQTSVNSTGDEEENKDGEGDGEDSDSSDPNANDDTDAKAGDDTNDESAKDDAAGDDAAKKDTDNSDEKTDEKTPGNDDGSTVKPDGSNETAPAKKESEATKKDDAAKDKSDDDQSDN